MKAEELRIGNWIWNPVQKIPVQVDIRLLNDIFYYEKAKKYSGLEPIPLTEQWLLDLGFAKIQNIYQRFNQILLDPEPSGYYNVKFWTTSLSRAEPIYKNYLKIKYVHQLQNIYFALTGKELKCEYNGKGKH